MATTHFVFANDAELLPSPDVIPKFLSMIHKNGAALRATPNPKGPSKYDVHRHSMCHS